MLASGRHREPANWWAGRGLFVYHRPPDNSGVTSILRVEATSGSNFICTLFHSQAVVYRELVSPRLSISLCFQKAIMGGTG